MKGTHLLTWKYLLSRKYQPVLSLGTETMVVTIFAIWDLFANISADRLSL